VSGDTLFSIAGKYQINYLSMLAANPSISTPDVISIGQVVILPCNPALVCKANYIVKSGDTVFNIGQANGVSLQDMLAANPQLVNPDMVYPGDLVFVPPCSQTPQAVRAVALARPSCKQTTYTAKAGDHVGKIAAMFNINPGELYRLNPTLKFRSTAVIKAGQVLAVLNCPKAMKLPFTTPRSCLSMFTVAQSGETPKSVAGKKGTTATKIMLANTWITSPTQVLPVRRKLCIQK